MLRKLATVGLILGLTAMPPVGAWSGPGYAQPLDQVRPGQFIVVVKAGVAPEEVAQRHGLVPEHVYTHAVNGFAAPIPPPRLAAVGADPAVDLVEPDRVVSLVPPQGPPIVRAQLHANDFETLTSGIDRIDADLNPRTDVSAVGIAIIDTGIYKNHVDLNVAGGRNCTGGNKNNWGDGHGHGTHVAGIAAAKTGDSKGVRGVAPNARLYGVKVLNNGGSGSISSVICGVNWVTQNAASRGIKVANMSLGFFGSSSTLNTAISNSVAAGVTYAAAAGNGSTDASGFSPANHPSVITVSALGDSDGTCGAAGANTSNGADDTLATFSNFGSTVELAAPGVDITSTYKDGLYAAMSGTSMASPHVAGAAALYVASHPGASPSAVQTALINAGVAQTQGCTANTGNGGFSGDPDSSHEPLVYARNL